MVLPIADLASLQIANPINPDTNAPLNNTLGQGGFAVAQMTEAQRNTLVVGNSYSGINAPFTNGCIVYNTNTNAFNFYEGGNWEELAFISTINALNAKEEKRNKKTDLLITNLRKRIEKLEKINGIQ